MVVHSCTSEVEVDSSYCDVCVSYSVYSNPSQDRREDGDSDPLIRSAV